MGILWEYQAPQTIYGASRVIHTYTYTYRYVHIICIYQVYRGCKLLSNSRAWLRTGSTVLSIVVPIMDCNDPVSTSQESSRTPLYLNQSGKLMIFYQPDSCRHLGMIPLYIHHDGSDTLPPPQKYTHTHIYIILIYIYIIDTVYYRYTTGNTWNLGTNHLPFTMKKRPRQLQVQAVAHHGVHRVGLSSVRLREKSVCFWEKNKL